VLAKVTPSPGSSTADRPNEVWQIDHTVVDVIVVDEEHRRPIGRPVLTVAIDVCTRMVAGFYLSLDPPSASSVGLCLLHAVYDKGAWLGERGLILTGPSQACPGFYTAITSYVGKQQRRWASRSQHTESLDRRCNQIEPGGFHRQRDRSLP
jgi:transposase InsO family protein